MPGSDDGLWLYWNYSIQRHVSASEFGAPFAQEGKSASLLQFFDRVGAFRLGSKRHAGLGRTEGAKIFLFSGAIELSESHKAD